MPQMSPLLWLNLMLMFLLTFLIFFSVTYFNKLYMSSGKKMKSKKICQKNWNW